MAIAEWWWLYDEHYLINEQSKPGLHLTRQEKEDLRARFKLKMADQDDKG